MIRLKVGQIVYVLFEEHRTVLPARVVAENRAKTLEGTKITYEIVLGAGDQRKEMQVNDSNCERVFDSAKKVQNYLTQQATTSIGEIVSQAENLAEEWYGGDAPASADDDEEDEQPRKPLTPTRPMHPGPKVDLGNGQVANIIVSEPRSE